MDRGVGKKAPPPLNLSHITYYDEIWHSYILPKSNPKNIWITWHMSWVLLTSAIFHRKSANFAISRNTRVDCILIQNFLIFLTFLESLKIVLIKKVAILMMSAKVATPGLLKIRVFWNKGYNVIIYVHEITNKILSHDSNYIVDAVMWAKFGQPSISMREVIIISIL